MEKHPLLVVRLRVDPDKEEALNDWYRNFLDTLVPVAPDFVSVRRFMTTEGGQKTYLTIYEIKDEASIESAMAVFDRPERQAYRPEWAEWENSAVQFCSVEIYVQVYP